MTETILPDKLSDLLELALTDVASVRDDKRYTVDMAVWHDSRFPDNTCHVCMAGAVMARRLGVDPGGYRYPWEFFDLDTQNKLDALDHLRVGNIGRAFLTFERDCPAMLPTYVETPVYFRGNKGYDEWLACMNRLVAVLRSVGE